MIGEVVRTESMQPSLIVTVISMRADFQEPTEPVIFKLYNPTLLMLVVWIDMEGEAELNVNIEES